MNTQEIANRLVELCRVGDYETAVHELYSPEVISRESEWSPEPRTAHGFEGLAEKAKMFSSMFTTMDNFFADEPIVSGNVFAVRMGMDGTMPDGKVEHMDEIAVYTVRDGKIIREEFFYTM